MLEQQLRLVELTLLPLAQVDLEECNDRRVQGALAERSAKLSELSRRFDARTRR